VVATVVLVIVQEVLTPGLMVDQGALVLVRVVDLPCKVQSGAQVHQVRGMQVEEDIMWPVIKLMAAAVAEQVLREQMLIAVFTPLVLFLMVVLDKYLL
jgi:hypothetical protein